MTDSLPNEDIKNLYRNRSKRVKSESIKETYAILVIGVMIMFTNGLQPAFEMIELRIMPLRNAAWTDVIESIISLVWCVLILLKITGYISFYIRKAIFYYQIISYLYLLNSGLNLGYGSINKGIVDLVLFFFISSLAYGLLKTIDTMDGEFRLDPLSKQKKEKKL